MSGKRGLERYDGVQMGNWLVREHGAQFDRQTGDHVHYKLTNGRRVGTLAGPQKVPTRLARANAEVLGLSLAEFRAALGYPNVNAGKPRKRPTPTKAPRRDVGKSDALRVIDDVSALLDTIAGTIRCGQRDPSVYERIHVACCDARETLKRVES